jgi:hypothetical protein
MKQLEEEVIKPLERAFREKKSVLKLVDSDFER